MWRKMLKINSKMNQQYYNIINSLPLFSRGLLTFKVNKAIMWPVTLEGHTAGFRFSRVWSLMDPVTQRVRPTGMKIHFLLFRNKTVKTSENILDQTRSNIYLKSRVEDWFNWTTFRCDNLNICEEERCWK